jgi:ribosomal protein L16/L10AE
MGKGKGPVKFWITRVAYGKIMFEFNRIRRKRMLFAFRKCGEMLLKPFVVVRYSTRKWKKKFNFFK